MSNSTLEFAPGKPRRPIGVPRLPAENPLLIGRSALGSHLLKQMKGMGWRNWRIIDNDGRLALNLEKHEHPKISRGLRITGLINRFEKVAATGEDGRGEKKRDPGAEAGKADLIVDVSGSDSVRGLLSGKNLSRCASMFMTPRGDDSVLLLEDWRRKSRLDGLHAQYYRWLIRHGPVDSASEDRANEIQTDEKYRDVRAKRGRDAVEMHAVALRLQLLSLVDKPDPAVVIYVRGRDGRNTVHRAKTRPAMEQRVHEWRIVWDKGVEEQVLEMRWKALPRETGGVVMGWVDHPTTTIFVVDFHAAPKDSEWKPTSFQRGSHGVSEEVEATKNRTGGKVDYVGEWRSHPDAMVPIPGMKDLMQLARGRDEMALTDHPPLILIIGENDIMFHLML